MNDSESLKRREQLLAELDAIEFSHLDVIHSWNKAVHNYRSKRRKLLKELEEINQLCWEMGMEVKEENPQASVSE